MFKLNTLPFFFKFFNENNNGGFPKALPFHLFFDNDLRMFRQQPTDEIQKTLDEIYKQGSLVEGSTSSESGLVYRKKINDYLFSNFPFTDASEVLEVGFGSGIMLRELKQRGIINLTGVEPGNHTRVEGLESITLIRDFFPSKLITKKFDLVYSLFVLEHIDNPLDYLNKLISHTNANGKVIFSVPNCEPYIQEGDISIFIHEHFSYFTGEAIHALVDKTNFSVEDISIIEGSFIVTISGTGKNVSAKNRHFEPAEFYSNVDEHIEKLNRLFSKYKDEDVMIYAPVRAMNLLFLINKVNFRLVDDSSEIHGRFLPSLSSSVESFENMLSNPPKCILIFSRTFGDRIKARCLAEDRLKNTRVLSLTDLE
jgi:2-polyprenyl-3-methyl-5-hydroxy-6-metoxy-1,4-benzoquinol methylase